MGLRLSIAIPQGLKPFVLVTFSAVRVKTLTYQSCPDTKPVIETHSRGYTCAVNVEPCKLGCGRNNLSKTDVRYAVASLSDCGNVRPTNEDAFGVSAEHGVYVVCDGMGGAAAGEIASSMAVDVVLRLLDKRDGETSLEVAVEEAIRAANEAIHSRAEIDFHLNGMGTTLAGLATEGRRVLVFNVGDSRCYRLREGRLEQISQDHSLVEEQVRMGRMTQEEAQRSPLRNVITRALGTQPSVEPDLFPLEAEDGDIFLLCSDGLTGEVPDPEIESLLAFDLPLEQLCANLVEAANLAGGHDNITCVLVRAEG
jgi:protein phosphatase